MAVVDTMMARSGMRIGFWDPHPVKRSECFRAVGVYNGPDLGDIIPGSSFEQELMEGTLKFKFGVLFRPDLGKRQSLEPILIIMKYVPEMFEYDNWDSLNLSQNGG